MRTDRLPLPPPAERQLALPLEPAADPPALAGLGPGIPPRRIWRGLSPAAQAAVRRAVLRVCREVAHDAAGRR
jgi:hypothetical protein